MSKPKDGPKMSSQPFFWRPEAFQGKPYPNMLSLDEMERDQWRLDNEAACRILLRTASGEKIDRWDREDRARLARRHREKRGH
jgi:hypothetical protein